MSEVFTRLARRSLGQAPQVRPVLTPLQAADPDAREAWEERGDVDPAPAPDAPAFAAPAPVQTGVLQRKAFATAAPAPAAAARAPLAPAPSAPRGSGSARGDAPAPPAAQGEAHDAPSLEPASPRSPLAASVSFDASPPERRPREPDALSDELVGLDAPATAAPPSPPTRRSFPTEERVFGDGRARTVEAREPPAPTAPRPAASLERDATPHASRAAPDPMPEGPRRDRRARRTAAPSTVVAERDHDHAVRDESAPARSDELAAAFDRDGGGGGARRRRGGRVVEAHGPTTVHVTIGRVEVRASAPRTAAPGPAAPAPRASTNPILSLDQYLKERAGGRS